MLLPASAPAQSAGSIHHNPPPVALAARRDGPITIDGKLEESAWQAAPPITAFVQTQPVEGAPATQRTEIRVLYDADALYIGARMFDSLGARGVRGRIIRRDQQLDLDNSGASQLTSDKLTIILDPFHDHLTRAVFEINPVGGRGDALGAGGSNLDPSWDPIWEAATSIDSLGWTAEIRIPLSQLRFAPHDSAQSWGMQVVRTIDRLNERDWWAFSRRNENNGPATYGHLTGLQLGRPPRQFELLPYVSAQTEGNAANIRDPLNPVRHNQARAGADVKYLLGSTPRSSTCRRSRPSSPRSGRSSSRAPAPSISVASTATSAAILRR
jgi:Carbohydrate family 9 binding domain-like